MDTVTNARHSLRHVQTVPLAGVFTREHARSWILDLTWSLRIYLCALVIAEFAAVTRPAWGLVLHLCLACALLAHSSFGPHRGRAVVFALALAPLVRVVSLGLAFTDLPPLIRYALAAVSLAAAGGTAARALAFGRAELGLRIGQFQQQLRIGLFGLPLAGMQYVILRPSAIPVDLSAPGVQLTAPLLLIWLGLVEEFVFRGVLQAAARMDLGWRGLFYASAVYALLHVGSGSVDAAFMAFCVGLAFAGVVARTGSLLGVSLAHSLANLVLHVVLPRLAAIG
jgi:uncharacterized protein